jgi:hypothetical protein
MHGFVLGLWGLFGSFAVEGLDLCAVLRSHGQWPWKLPASPGSTEVPEAGLTGYAIAEVVRLLVGAGLAWAAAENGQVAGSLGALGVGVAAPTIIGQLAKVISLKRPPSDITPDFARVPDSINVPARGSEAAAEVMD